MNARDLVRSPVKMTGRVGGRFIAGSGANTGWSEGDGRRGFGCGGDRDRGRREQ